MGPSQAQEKAVAYRRSVTPDEFAAARAREFVRGTLTEAVRRSPGGRTGAAARFVDEAMLLTSELVTNAVLHAGTDIEVLCRLRYASVPPSDGPDGPDGDRSPGNRVSGVIVEVVDQHPARAVRVPGGPGPGEPGYGLRLVSALTESWGVTYRHHEKRVWFHLEARRNEPIGTGAPADSGARTATAPSPGPAAEWVDRGGPSFLAETSELLAGQLDQELVTALTAQLLVPRIADWCAIWLSTEGEGMRLARVWHRDERRIGALRADLVTEPPSGSLRPVASPWPWPRSASEHEAGGTALAFPLVAQGVRLGVLLLGRSGRLRMTDSMARLVEDVARRVAQAVLTARQYTRQATITRALQRRQLPAELAPVAGVDTAVVYEPHAEGQTVGGDFYDIFSVDQDRWCFLLGDVQGKDPEAMSVTGLARHLVRLLAREGHGVESVLARLNTAMTEDSAEAARQSDEHTAPRFLSLLYGELSVTPGKDGVHCRLASAGHPLPLHLFEDGRVEAASDPQLLLGIDEGTRYHASSFDLCPSETLLCVTDGVTERRYGTRQLDDNDGLVKVLGDGLGLGAKALAEHVRRAAHEFGAEPVEDDLSILVLQARHTLSVPPPGTSPRTRKRP